MKLEAGKYYRTRDGRKTLLSANDSRDEAYPWFCDVNDWHGLDPMGRSCIGDSSVDLVSEWIDGPVRTVTRKEIVGGMYGVVEVVPGDWPKRVGIRMSNLHGPGGPELHCDAAQLREAATLFDQLASALEQPS
jgi:hypothetical protein